MVYSSPHDYSQPIKYTDIDTSEKEGPYCPVCFFDKERLVHAKVVTSCSFRTMAGTTYWCCTRKYAGPNHQSEPKEWYCDWEVLKDSS